MPRLPTADEINRVSVRPSTDIVQYRDDQIGQAMEQAGHVVERTAERVYGVVDEVADNQARGALAELKRRQNLLTIGDGGYARLQNEDAIAPGVMQKYVDRHDAEVADVASKLSPMAKQRFLSMSVPQKAVFQAGFLKHAMREDLASRGKVYAANVEVSAETAGINYNNPEILLQERAALDKTVANYVQNNGIRDKALIERTLQEARGQFHQSVINAYLDEDQVHNAEAYFAGIKQEMTPERAKAVTNMLKPEVANRIGRDVADKMFQMHLAGDSESAILDEQLKLTEGKPKEALTVAKQLYNARTNALEADRVKQSGAILLSAFQGAPGSGVSDRRLREIDMQDPALGVRIRKQLQGFANKAGEASSPRDKLASMTLYEELSNRIRDGELIEGGLAQYIDRLPESKVNKLMTLQNSVRTTSGKQKLNTAFVNAGMPKSAKDKESQRAARGFMEERLQDWLDANPGKMLTPEDEKAIINSAGEEFVQVRRGWLDKTISAYEAPGRTAYPKNLDTLMKGASEDDKIAAYATIQKVRSLVKPGDRRFSDAEIIDIWKQDNGR